MTKEAENISRIRDILFGNNLTEFEKRLEKSDQASRDSLSSLEMQVSRQLAEMRLLMEENKQLQQTIVQKEKETLTNSISRLKEEINLLDQRLNQTLISFEESLRETRQWMAEKSESLHQEQVTLLNEYKKHVTDSFGEIQSSKVDRSSLAVLFSEIAMQLAGKKEDN